MKQVLLLLISSTNLLTATTVVKTTPPTTPKTTPTRGCLYEGRFYADGDTIEEDIYKCYGAFCENGSPIFWDDKCNFEVPPCSGWTERVVGQCCPVCHGTTAVTTTGSTTPTDTVPPGGCVDENGRQYGNGQVIDKDEEYNCYGTTCMNGEIIHWDGECFLYEPHCDGWTEKVPGQCCPVCHNNGTTSAPTIPQGSCLVDNRVVLNGESVSSDPNNCNRSVCSYGVVLNEETHCVYIEDMCPGEWERLPGQCCKVCVTNTTAFQLPDVCSIGNTNFTEGSKTVDDSSHPCETCQCMSNGTWSCVSVKCPTAAVSDCQNIYRPPGECCYTCSGTKNVICLTLVSILLLISVLSDWTEVI